MSKNKTEKGAKPAPAPAPEKVAKLPKGGADVRNIPLAQIRIKKGFNPRKDLGDLSALISSIKQNGIISPVTVCPIKPGAEEYYLVAGHRRFAAQTEIGKAVIPAVVRTDFTIDSLEALSLAMSENSDEGRTNLSPSDAAAAFHALMEKMDDLGAVAKACGVSRKTVERSLKFYEAPKAIKERVDSNQMSRLAALAVIDAPEDLQKEVLKRLPESNVSERDVRTAIKEVQIEAKKKAKNDGEDAEAAGARKTKSGKVSKKNKAFGAEPGMIVTPVSASGVSDMRFRLGKRIYNLRLDLDEKGGEDAEIQAAIDASVVALVTLCWQAGILDTLLDDAGEMLTSNKAAKKAVERCVEEAVERAEREAKANEAEEPQDGEGDDEAEAEPEKKKKAKKEKTEKKAKKEKKEKTEKKAKAKKKDDEAESEDGDEDGEDDGDEDEGKDAKDADEGEGEGDEGDEDGDGDDEGEEGEGDE